MDQEEGDVRYLAYFARLRNLVRVGTRYLAYTSDVGEAVRPVVRPWIVNGAYGISFAYVGADIAYHTAKQNDEDPSLTLRTLTERTVFQGLASLVLPAFTIHSIVDLTAKIMKRRGAGQFAMRWGPSGIGLLAIPLLPTVLDEPVEWAIERIFHEIWPVPKHKSE